ncbi:helix-turn-helix domain-containing protein [Streptomyces sp. NPDC002306]
MEEIVTPETLTDTEAAGLIRVVREQRRVSVGLAHPLYGEFLRSNLPEHRRRALLLEQGKRIKSRGMRRRDDALRIATWTLAATGAADPGLLHQAASLARHAHEYEQVQTFLKALPSGDHTPDSRLMLGESLFQTGQGLQAEAMLAQMQSDEQRTDSARDLTITLVRTANLILSLGDISAALSINSAAVSRHEGSLDRSVLQLDEGYLRICAGQPSKGLSLLNAMENDVTQAPAADVWLRAASVKPIALAMVGRTDAAVAWAERAYSANMLIHEHTLVLHPAVQRGAMVIALTEAGKLPLATAMGERAYTEITTSSTIARMWIAFFTARANWVAGHVATSRTWFAETCVLARKINHSQGLRSALSGLAACAAVLGDLITAEASLVDRQATDGLSSLFVSAGEESLGPAWLLAAQGHSKKAIAMLIAAAEEARSTGHTSSEALLLTDVARLGGAAGVVDRLTQLAEKHDGALALARANLASALAESNPNLLFAVAAELEAAGADLLAAEAATAASAIHQRRGQTRDATAANRRGSVLLARCQRAHTPLLSTAQSVVPLTAREREVAALAAVGATSKDIAQSIGLSVRTIDNHLNHVYAKLGVSTRKELTEILSGESGP